MKKQKARQRVVQQKPGRVKPTLQMKGVAINDDAGLEREADAMGAAAGRGGGEMGGRKSSTRVKSRRNGVGQ
jgi:hypothetical protein